MRPMPGPEDAAEALARSVSGRSDKLFSMIESVVSTLAMQEAQAAADQLAESLRKVARSEVQAAVQAALAGGAQPPPLPTTPAAAADPVPVDTERIAAEVFSRVEAEMQTRLEMLMRELAARIPGLSGAAAPPVQAAPVDTEAICDAVAARLQPRIEAAVKEALRETAAPTPSEIPTPGSEAALLRELAQIAARRQPRHGRR